MIHIRPGCKPVYANGEHIGSICCVELDEETCEWEAEYFDHDYQTRVFPTRGEAEAWIIESFDADRADKA